MFGQQLISQPSLVYYSLCLFQRINCCRGNKAETMSLDGVQRCDAPLHAYMHVRMHAGDCAGAAAAAADAQNASTGTPVDEAAVTSARSSAASCGSPGAVLPVGSLAHPSLYHLLLFFVACCLTQTSANECHAHNNPAVACSLHCSVCIAVPR